MKKYFLLLIVVCNFINVAIAKELFVSDDTRQQLGAAQAYYEQAKYTEGLQTLESLLKQRLLSDYAKALAYQLQGYLFAGNNQLSFAVAAFDNSLKLDVLEDSVSLNLRFNLAQILVATEQYELAVPHLELWLQKNQKITVQQQVLIATTYYFAKQYKLAIKFIHEALERDSNPSRQNYQLALAIYLESNESIKAIEILQKALANFPDDENFWKQLANLYRQANQQQLAVASLQTAYDANLMQEMDVVNLAKMLFYLEAPYTAADLLNKALSRQKIKNSSDNYKLLAECWLAAREYEKASSSFAEAARIANDGDLYLRQAEIMLEREQWSESVIALQKAFMTEKISDEGRARLLLGIANYEAGNILDSKKAFESAGKHAAQASYARQWLLLLDSRF